MLELPALPAEIKHIAHFLKIADEHDERNIVVSYWSRMWACHAAINSIKGTKSQAVTMVLVSIMDWLERTKKENSNNDGITNETVAQSQLEEYALQLFSYADACDLAQNYGKNVVKAFYTAGILMDVLTQFGPLSDDLFEKRKYAKWKAAYIHNCLRRGEPPVPGPRKDPEEEDDDDGFVPNSARINFFNGVDPLKKLEEDKEADESSSPVPEEQTDEKSDAPELRVFPDPIQPTPYVPQPSTFVPQQPPLIPQQPPAAVPPSPTTSTTSSVGPEQIEKAQKYCKFAGSALDYDDVNTAINNLQKALHLLQYGEEKV